MWESGWPSPAAAGVEGKGLTVAVDRALSVEVLVTELNRDRASFLVIVTRHGPRWTNPWASRRKAAGSGSVHCLEGRSEGRQAPGRRAGEGDDRQVRLCNGARPVLAWAWNRTRLDRSAFREGRAGLAGWRAVVQFN